LRVETPSDFRNAVDMMLRWITMPQGRGLDEIQEVEKQEAELKKLFGKIFMVQLALGGNLFTYTYNNPIAAIDLNGLRSNSHEPIDFTWFHGFPIKLPDYCYESAGNLFLCLVDFAYWSVQPPLCPFYAGGVGILCGLGILRGEGEGYDECILKYIIYYQDTFPKNPYAGF